MKIFEILEKYSDVAIDQLAADKVDESTNLRLPRNIIVQEIISALSSLTYVAEALAPSKPPTYAFIKLLLEAQDHMLPVEGFQEKVMQATFEMTTKAQSGEGLLTMKNYKLYINVLKNAWESGNEIDRSEAQLLEALRNELGIWTREHLLLEHHTEIKKLWDVSDSYVAARNRLLLTGLVLTFENNCYERMLNGVKNEQLYNALEKVVLMVSGTKEEKIERIINALVPPFEFLDTISIDELREYCRQNNIQVSGKKSDVISNIINHFEQRNDLKTTEEAKGEPLLPLEPEERELNNESFSRLLENLNNDQLYDMLSKGYLKTSGTKEEKINRLVESPWSEKSLLNNHRKIELSNLCWRLGIPISGIKSEIIERVIEGASVRFSESYQKAAEEDQEGSIEAKQPDIEEKTSDVGEIEVLKKQIELPKAFEEIAAQFPELEKDEQIILALLKETKSLTEQDIERASKRHGLGWFLIKARLSEMIYKLRKSHKMPIRVKSVRSINIYEWIGEKLIENNLNESKISKDIIDALRQGVVPEKNLDVLLIGQSKTHQYLKNLLDETKINESFFKFIRGPYE